MSQTETLQSIEEVRAFVAENDHALLFISSQGCSVCSALWPRIQDELETYDNIALGYVDVDEVKEVSGEYLVFTAPITLVFQNQKEVMREDRFIRIEAFSEKMDLMLT
ncbi:thioredoxin-like negative regulator of GroEL [Alkalibacillus flavidus]|uniref:Thioredoxin-like negative regulator of GroEL n=1 Tax=Alkalibacillus flavidus TaxID=546021 RepID=A0ABV2KY46_9BACI